MSNHEYCKFNCGGTDCDSPEAEFTGREYKIFYSKWWEFWKPRYEVIYFDE